jgi:ferric-dicitrate binding protein FerR (iron transport regulator)
MRIDQEQFQKLLDSYLKGTASEDERRLLDEFFQSYEKEAAEQSSIPQNDVVKKFLKARIDERIGKDKYIERSVMKPVRRFSYASLAVAAAVSFIVICFAVYYNRTSTPAASTDKDKPVAILVRQTKAGQRLTIKLSDGTIVKLNSGTTLRFPERFSDTLREVSVDGEAYFEVTHDARHPFVVRTPQASTRVLGTSFNINTRDTLRTAITLVEGKVNVSSFNASVRPVVLAPHQQAVVTEGNEKISTTAVDIQAFVEWKDDVLRFDEEQFDQVIDKLENWYGVDIRTTKTKISSTCMITGRYHRESLENILNSLSFMMKFRYKINGKVIYITGGECR